MPASQKAPAPKPSAAPTRSDAGLATELRISVSRLARRLRAERVARGVATELSDTQLAALAALERHHEMTPGELAEHEKVQPPSMTRVIAALTERTAAIVVVHLFGNPCDMDAIMEIARARSLPVIEDCAQAYCTPYGNRWVGTIGSIGCFSMQQSKHLPTGETPFHRRTNGNRADPRLLCRRACS